MTIHSPNNEQHDDRSDELVTQTEQEQKIKDEQARLQKLYRQQQARLACPGCGEEPFVG